MHVGVSEFLLPFTQGQAGSSPAESSIEFRFFRKICLVLLRISTQIVKEQSALSPVERGQAGSRVVSDPTEIVADGLARHNLHIASFLDTDIGVEALVGHGHLYDLASKLNLHLNGGLVQAIKLCRLGFDDFVPAKGQRLRYRHTILVGLDGIHQFSGPVVVNLAHCIRNGGSSGPSVHGVVVLRGLGNLDLARNRGIFPCDLRRLSRLHIDRFLLGIRDIPLVFQLSQIVTACLQVLNVDISTACSAI